MRKKKAEKSFSGGIEIVTLKCFSRVAPFPSHTEIELATLSLSLASILKRQFFYYSKAFSFYCADHHKKQLDIQSRPLPRRFVRFLLLYATPTALSYFFSYHLIIIAVCTIASFQMLNVRRAGGRRNGAGEGWLSNRKMKLKSRTSWHLFDHVLFWLIRSPFNVVIRSSGALALTLRSVECSLICEVNWHVFIRHRVIKSNLRHPHVFTFTNSNSRSRSRFGNRREKNASLKCLISYNYLIIPGEPRMPLNSSPSPRHPPLLAQCERVSNFPPSSSVKTHSFGGKVSWN